MHKVVVERPRWNPGSGKHGRRANLPYDLLPKFEGIKRLYNDRKGLTDLLGPLRRWLQSQVGRPWNDIYSEACAVIKPDSIIRAHIKTHLLEFVERHAFMHNGQVCFLNTSYRGGIMPLAERQWGRTRFFVHPETDLLQVIPRISKRVRKARNSKPPETVHWLKSNVAIQKIRGRWFECYYEVVGKGEASLGSYDYALERLIATHSELIRYDRSYLKCTRKRQLSKRELRRMGLRNAPSRPSTGAQSSTGRICRRLKTVLRSSVGLFCNYDRSMMTKNESYHSFLHGLGCSQLGAFSG